MDIQKAAIDLGIVTNNLDAMLAFYGDKLGLDFEATIDMPGGGVMHRYRVGDSVVKIVETEPRPPVEATPGGIRAATGYRYWTIHVPDINALVAKLEGEGVEVAVPVKTIRPGVAIAMVVDPDGNWVELLQNS
jgi:catechol 2,3-dioxygenase-like lactoylglutathione lyase family enzyme